LDFLLQAIETGWVVLLTIVMSFVLLGPTRLVNLVRWIRRFLDKLRKIADEFKDTISDEFKDML